MMTFKTGLAAVALLASLNLAAPAFAEGNLAANGTQLPDLVIDTAKLTFSVPEYDLETGKYYKLKITADDGADDLAIVAPELWRNSWVNQISVDGKEVKAGGLYSLEFDGGGTFDFTFVPIRPGEYDIWAPGYEDKGLKAKFVVK